MTICDVTMNVSCHDHPLRWQKVNLIENFNSVTIEQPIQEKERIEDTLEMLNNLPETANDEGATELASKQHRIWILELLRNSWSSTVASKMNALEEETLGDGIIMYYVFLRKT